MSTKKDQSTLIKGYLREQYPILPVDLIYLIAIFYNTTFIWIFRKKHHSKDIQYNNNYKLECNLNVQNHMTLTLLSKPKTISYIFIYYELSCNKLNFNWNGTSILRKGQQSLLCRHYKPPKIRNEYAFVLYITILREQYKHSLRAKMVRGVTMNYSDNAEWIINKNQINKFIKSEKSTINRSYYQICSSTFGRSRNWYLSLESVGYGMQLNLNVLILPSKAKNIKPVRSVTIHCNVKIIGFENDFHHNICNIFGYGDKMNLWRDNHDDTILQYIDTLRIIIKMELFKVYGLNTKEIAGNQWDEHGIYNNTH